MSLFFNSDLFYKLFLIQIFLNQNTVVTLTSLPEYVA